jgi:hypothetical protein
MLLLMMELRGRKKFSVFIIQKLNKGLRQVWNVKLKSIFYFVRNPYYIYTDDIVSNNINSCK